ncbi:cytochrome bd ubiquinol oxidase subunit [Stereum hirsutum FP-91666 SS1]|uniref:cytochrome bd ubiquinol oxidase subunit n=1 Tax=Stereum hirsutum (strain FP-91666) TaxID=721885 RepID=UPI000440AEF5|nr:cytochrome bd ubiquinol oxidase subunit [Stereum hirsutum FP-91666 SS1]EIM90466.1 cytochrome bd ubiquinol oxidase subunit [Stereum hirsutum FP-91666 SS1]
MFGPLGFSLAPIVRKSPTLLSWTKPFANWYVDKMGYRKVGFKYDDLLVEERDDVQRALGRLTPAEAYDRAFRLKRASQASVQHKDLPKDQWTKPEEDSRYLKPHVVDVAQENAERATWDTMEVSRKR